MNNLVETATRQISSWLANWSAALERHDWPAAAALFQDDCYWRDLVSFTWNIKTLEGRAEIQTALEATGPLSKPRHWQILGEGTTKGDVTEEWFTFETAVARGKGYLRLKDGQCWTLLTT